MRDIDLVVNHLPSLTWHRLGVNDAKVSCHSENENAPRASVSVRGAEEIEVNEMNPERAREWADDLSHGILREKYVAGKRAIYQSQQFATGLGRTFTDYLSENVRKTALYHVKRGARIETPVIIEQDFADGSADALEQIIYAEEGAEAVFVILSRSENQAGGVEALGTKVIVEKGARVKLVKVNLLGAGFTQLDDTGAIVEDDGLFEFAQVEAGGAKTYTGLSASLFGERSKLELDTGYLVLSDHLLDINYVVPQFGKKTESALRVNGVLGENARKVFRGTIDFRNGSSGSVGDEQEDVLLLDPHVINKTVPVILCEEEDVDGRHGATIGRLPENVLFYMGTRGISEKEAERIMVRGRILSVARTVPDESIQKEISARIDEVYGEA